MDSLTYIINKFSINLRQSSPIEIPDTGRVTLAALFAELGYGQGAEVGVAEGRFSIEICKANPTAKLYCVDAWKVYQGYRDYQDQEKVSQMFENAKKRLAGQNVEFVHDYSMDAVKHFPDESLDFVYIDANHEWPFVTHDIYYWSKKVRSGGIVSGHDYVRSMRLDSKCHVIAAVNGYTFGFRIDPWFLLGTKAKTPGLIRDTCRSWFWVKP